MKQEVLHIFPDYPDADLVCYLHRDAPELQPQPHRAVIICPGGAYRFLSEREDEPIALAYMSEGFQAFVLHYGICDHARNCEPLVEACLAVRYVREHAAELNVDPAHIFITGFSAGGHCAAWAGVLWDHPAVKAAFGDAPIELGRPDGMILCYPVITAGPFAHRLSILTLCGNDSASEQEQAAFSLENFVRDTTPPAFLWHTSDDGGVPVQNSLLFAAALGAHHVPFELHVYPHGAHGLSLCDERTCSRNPALLAPVPAQWLAAAIRWAKEL